MENQTITGVGCFAEPRRLSRIFLRMVETYTLGKMDVIDWIKGCGSEDTEGSRLLEALVAGSPAGQNVAIPGTDARWPQKRITGFFLTLKDQRLKLSILAKIGDRQLEWHSAFLNEFSRMRRNRMN